MKAPDADRPLGTASPREGTIPTRGPAGLGLRPTPLDDRHLSRWAVVYVRQSDPQQVLAHQGIGQWPRT